MFYSLQQKISIAWVIQGDKMEERLRKHNSSHKGFTGHVGDWKVVYTELSETKEEAYKREREVKARKSRSRIEALIKNYKMV